VDNPLSLDDIRVLLELLQQHDVTEFKFERAQEKLFLRRGELGAETQQVRAPHIQQVFAPFGGSGVAIPSAVEQMREPGPISQVSSAAVEPAVPAANISQAEPAAEKKKKLAEVTSPMVGTFYRRPAVDANPYVEVGDMVRKGDILCIVEAMKLMNEIESEYAGRIVEICLEDGQMVEYGEPLFRIETA